MGKCEEKLLGWPSKTRRRSHEDALTSECNTTADSSPPWWDSVKSMDQTRQRSEGRVDDGFW
ncbi:hypothetical protein PHAVU_001G120100 [Phaseolus vulgaris]|uniref:Uncharacterized protein n=1 Tax=Phaseolus vulgaris TaxID=3885 RepID=V7CYR9_PHAVU|nr:hypothetical protein PHAVU_001G120100g [Phaseolus vulgaris]ESW34051.1 hypothetical protein PHAVU_001G120100g [Phaseolus vulgaris]